MTTNNDALREALDLLDEIVLAGMSGTGMESPEAMMAFHAKQAWKFIGVAAQAKGKLEALAASKPEPQAQEGESEVKPLLPDDPLLHQTHLPPDWKGRCESACEKWPDCLCANLQKPMTTEELRIKSLQTEIEVLDENLAKKDAALKACVEAAETVKRWLSVCGVETLNVDPHEVLDAAITQAQEAKK